MIEIESGGTNVYDDLARPDAAAMLVKAQLAAAIAGSIGSRGLTRSAAARIVGMPLPRLSALLRGQFRGVSEAEMLDCLTRLGHGVDVRSG